MLHLFLLIALLLKYQIRDVFNTALCRRVLSYTLVRTSAVIHNNDWEGQLGSVTVKLDHESELTTF